MIHWRPYEGTFRDVALSTLHEGLQEESARTRANTLIQNFTGKPLLRDDEVRKGIVALSTANRLDWLTKSLLERNRFFEPGYMELLAAVNERQSSKSEIIQKIQNNGNFGDCVARLLSAFGSNDVRELALAEAILEDEIFGPSFIESIQKDWLSGDRPAIWSGNQKNSTLTFSFPEVKDPKAMNSFHRYFGHLVEKICDGELLDNDLIDYKGTVSKYIGYPKFFKFALQHITLLKSLPNQKLQASLKRYLQGLDANLLMKYMMLKLNLGMNNDKAWENLYELLEYKPARSHDHEAMRLSEQIKELVKNKNRDGLIQIFCTWLAKQENKDILIAIMRSEQFLSLLSVPRFAKVFAESLSEDTSNGRMTFAHYLASQPKALNIAWSYIQDDFKLCLDLKDRRGATVQDYLNHQKYLQWCRKVGDFPS